MHERWGEEEKGKKKNKNLIMGKVMPDLLLQLADEVHRKRNELRTRKQSVEDPLPKRCPFVWFLSACCPARNQDQRRGSLRRRERKMRNHQELIVWASVHPYCLILYFSTAVCTLSSRVVLFVFHPRVLQLSKWCTPCALSVTRYQLRYGVGRG